MKNAYIMIIATLTLRYLSVILTLLLTPATSQKRNMVSARSPKITVSTIYANTFQLFKKNLIVFFPFAIVTLFELLSLAIFYLSPRMPLRLVLGPPIRTFWGEQFLHFPANLLLLPKLVSNGKVVLAVVLGSFCTCLAVSFIYDLYQKKHIKIGHSLKIAFNKYISAMCVVLLVYAAYFLILKLISFGLVKFFAGHRKLLFLGPAIWFGPVISIINILVGLVTQLVCIYAIPLLVIEQKKLLPSLIGSLVLVKKLFFTTFLLVLVPVVAYVPLLVLDYNLLFVVDRTFPEIVLALSAASTLFSTLLLDPVITCSTTLLYLLHKEPAPALKVG